MENTLRELLQERDGYLQEARGIKDLAKKEERLRTDEEQAKVDGLLVKIRTLNTTIEQDKEMQEYQERFSQPLREPVKIDPNDGPAIDPAGEQRFDSFGDFLMAVRQAEVRGGNVDPRLYEVRAATGMGEAVPADGGFLVQTDFSAQLLTRAYETGVLVSKVTRMPLSGNSDSIKVNAIDETSRATGSRWGGVQVYWKDEGSAATNKKPKFRQIKLEVNKLIGLCYATDELVADAAALESVIMQAFGEEFGFVLDDAIMNGDGAGKPLGILNGGGLVTVAKETGQAATTLVAENIENMYARMWGRSKRNGVWFINTDVWPQLFRLNHAIGTSGVPVFMPPGGISNSPFGSLFGRPIQDLEQCQTLGTKGDIYFADLSQYVLADKGAMQTASSMHVKFIEDEMTFRFTYRVDGQPIWNSPLTPYKGTANTLSPFITLAART